MVIIGIPYGISDFVRLTPWLLEQLLRLFHSKPGNIIDEADPELLFKKPAEIRG
ncbi:hypothetical protein D3C73_1523640 [compost metagenome]